MALGMVVEAIYQGGVLKPLQVLNLPENVHVWVQIIPIASEEALAREGHFKLQLLQLSLLREVRAPSGILGGDRTPIQVKGKPLSQAIIEERR
jgi:predicted DNA-binding antitoxin AbrB/MazE fold protein